MNLPERSPGRWCEKCNQHGSHHTERHDEYMRAIRERLDREKKRFEARRA